MAPTFATMGSKDLYHPSPASQKTSPERETCSPAHSCMGSRTRFVPKNQREPPVTWRKELFFKLVLACTTVPASTGMNACRTTDDHGGSRKYKRPQPSALGSVSSAKNGVARSEEHTSELQSHSFISY